MENIGSMVNASALKAKVMPLISTRSYSTEANQQFSEKRRRYKLITQVKEKFEEICLMELIQDTEITSRTLFKNRSHSLPVPTVMDD